MVTTELMEVPELAVVETVWPLPLLLSLRVEADWGRWLTVGDGGDGADGADGSVGGDGGGDAAATAAAVVCVCGSRLRQVNHGG